MTCPPGALRLPRWRLYWSRPAVTIDPRIVGRALAEVAWFLVALACFEVVEHLRGVPPGEDLLPTLFIWPF